MNSRFVKAQKYDSRLRMAIAGPAGAGKTYTSLAIASALSDGGRVAVIDTEHGSAAKASDRFDFDCMMLDKYPVQVFVDALTMAESEGYAVVVIDSLSHAWTGDGGVLTEKDRIAKSKYGCNTFAAWNDAGALQNKLVNAILSSKMHVIATLRSKMDYVQDRDDRGRTTVKKVGMAPVQRDDLPYEFDIFGHMEIDHTLVIEKSRCSALSGAVIPNPGAELADTIRDWLRGEPEPEPVGVEYVTRGMSILAVRMNLTPVEVRDRCLSECNLTIQPVALLAPDALALVETWVRERL